MPSILRWDMFESKLLSIFRRALLTFRQLIALVSTFISLSENVSPTHSIWEVAKIDLGLVSRKSDCRNFWKSDYRWTGPQLEVENVNNSPGGRHFPAVNCQPRNKVAILIPYRNRDRELRVLLHHLHPILQRQQLSYGIFVIEQVN